MDLDKMSEQLETNKLSFELL